MVELHRCHSAGSDDRETMALGGPPMLVDIVEGKKQSYFQQQGSQPSGPGRQDHPRIKFMAIVGFVGIGVAGGRVVLPVLEWCVIIRSLSLLL